MTPGARRLLVALTLTASLSLGALGVDPSPTAEAGAAGRPNVLVVMTDDQTVESMSVLGNVRGLIGGAGTTFTRSIVSFPLCCPSRATFLTGQYSQNHGVRRGGGYADLQAANTLPVWLQDAGYATGQVGKYVNGYGLRDRTEVPPGWTEWYATTGDTDQEVQNYLLNQNGQLIHYGAAAADFKGDVITRLARGFINRRAPAPEPFFLVVGYTAPHAAPFGSGPYQRCLSEAQPAPRHRGAFATAPLPRPPSFDEPDVSDKHTEIRELPPLNPFLVDQITVGYQCRLESLLHVDEGVADLIGALEASGELDSTLIIFTSDNGYFLGEHRIPRSKLYGYEEALQVPLLIRGPGVPAGKSVRTLAANIDLAPTILDAAGASAGVPQDGVSLFRLIGGHRQTRPVLIENVQAPATPYTGVRTNRYSYAEYADGGRELYDLRQDRWQLESVDSKRRYRRVVAWMHKRTRKLGRCQGAKCRRAAAPPRPLRN